MEMMLLRWLDHSFEQLNDWLELLSPKTSQLNLCFCKSVFFDNLVNKFTHQCESTCMTKFEKERIWLTTYFIFVIYATILIVKVIGKLSVVAENRSLSIYSFLNGCEFVKTYHFIRWDSEWRKRVIKMTLWGSNAKFNGKMESLMRFWKEKIRFYSHSVYLELFPS